MQIFLERRDLVGRTKHGTDDKMVFFKHSARLRSFKNENFQYGDSADFETNISGPKIDWFKVE